MSDPTRCSRIHTAYGVTRECRRSDLDPIHDAPEPGCAWPDTHHPYEEEPMPDPTVTVATVYDAHKGFRRGVPGSPDGYYDRVVLSWPEGVPLPKAGDRVAVAGSADAIFKWMETLPAKRIVDAARAWADMCDRIVQGGRDNLKRPEQKALYDAVRAAGTPSEDEAYEPPVIRDRARTGFDTGKGADRSATIITITITEGA